MLSGTLHRRTVVNRAADRAADHHANRRPSPRPRLAAAVVLAVLALSACSAEVVPPSQGESRDAGRDYGKTIRDTIGARATPEEMEELCGQGLIDGKIVGEKGGRTGDETDLEVDEFIAGCKEAVTAE
jgi:hypothetical protein